MRLGGCEQRAGGMKGYAVPDGYPTWTDLEFQREGECYRQGYAIPLKRNVIDAEGIGRRTGRTGVPNAKRGT